MTNASLSQSSPQSSPQSATVHRRALLQAAAWGTPAVLVASTAPSYATSAPSCAAYAGGSQTWTDYAVSTTFVVPDDGCISQLTYDVAGGGGGRWVVGGSSGGGARITGTIDLTTVRPGTVLQIFVGQGGSDSAGGLGFGRGGTPSGPSGGGGGGSAILLGDGTPLVVAGGAGGGGNASTAQPTSLATPARFTDVALPADNPPSVSSRGSVAFGGAGGGAEPGATGAALASNHGVRFPLAEGGTVYAQAGGGRPANGWTGGQGAGTWAFFPPARDTFVHRIGYGHNGGNGGTGLHGGGDGGNGGTVFSGARLGSAGGGGGYGGGGAGLAVSGSVPTSRYPGGEMVELASGGGGGSSYLAAFATQTHYEWAANAGQRGWVTLTWS